MFVGSVVEPNRKLFHVNFGALPSFNLRTLSTALSIR